MNIVKDYGHFGSNSAEYNAARSGFPDDVFDILWKHFNAVRPRILDVGCGTGIASRQLALRGAEVTGADIDPLMIEEAKNLSDKSINYITAPTELLPFVDASFDAVTAFSSFHWFANARAVAEIARVLAPRGTLMTINKDDQSDFRVGYRACIAKFIDKELPDIKKKYFPAELFRAGGFRAVVESTVYVSEFLSLDAMLRYLHSVSLWNLVPDERKAAADEALHTYCSQHLVGGMIERKITVRITLGIKS